MSAIDDKYAALGGATGWLGAPTLVESGTPDGRGRFRHYQNGSIYWSPATAAHEVHGSIRRKWEELGWETGFLGYPTTDETPTRDGAGRFSHFQGGTIYWSPATGAYVVRHSGKPKCSSDVSLVTSQIHTENWQNWHQNINRAIQVVKPQNVAELVDAVRYAEAQKLKLGVMGSGWSFSDCVVAPDTTLLIETSALKNPITRWDLKSVLLPSLAVRAEGSARANPFVHVEAGIKIHQLNCLLDQMGLALPTLGGSRGQSVAGVISTGVHGGDIVLPPIADAIRAIHLVGAGGQEWWIEPQANRITVAARMAILRDTRVLCPNINIVYDDNLFRACLVAMGCAGIIYSVVLEARAAFNLHSITRGISWTDAKNYIRTQIIGGTNRPRFAEIVINPANQHCRLTERRETSAPRTPAPVGGGVSGGGGDGTVQAVFAGIFLGPGAFGAFVGAVGDYIARTTAEIALLTGIPLAGLGLAAKKTAEALTPVKDAFDLMANLHILAIHPHDTARMAAVMPTAINLIWRIGFFVISGRQIVDEIQNALTNSSRPDRTIIDKSYIVMTDQPDCPSDGTQTHSAVEKLVESFEYGVPANKAIEFVERVLQITNGIRAGADALIVNLSLRFTSRTKALLGMQQFDRTCHVEIYTFKGMAANGKFHQQLHALVREMNATPHWGQFHDPATDFLRVYGKNLTRWRQAMIRLASESGVPQGTFWHGFAHSRGLLTAEYGSIIKLKHCLTGYTLHSHTARYGHAGSSGQQQVTAFAEADDNDLWCVTGNHSQPADFRAGQLVRHGDIIRLEHLLTSRNLHSHHGFPSPVSGQQEVTGFGENGVGDNNDNWRVEIEGGGVWEVGKRVRLIHVLTNHALHSHQGFAHSQWTLDQQEVTCFAGRDDNDWWYLAEIHDGKIYNPNEIVQSLRVEIRMGREGTDTAIFVRSDPSDAVGFVRLRDGRVIEKNFSNDVSWAPFSTHIGQLDLPPGTRLGMIVAFGIRSIPAGPDHGADNWMIDAVKVTFVGATVSGTLLRRSGNPLWYFQKNANQVWEGPVDFGA